MTPRMTRSLFSAEKRMIRRMMVIRLDLNESMRFAAGDEADAVEQARRQVRNPVAHRLIAHHVVRDFEPEEHAGVFVA